MTHGPQAIADLVADAGWSYPVSKTRIEREFPLENVTIDAKGNSMLLGELLAEVEVARFADETELLSALNPAFEAERERRHVGVLGTVKRFVLGTYTR